MLEIAIDLVGTDSLGCIANPGVGALAALPAGMPLTPGIYLIFNPGTSNRYMGISANIASRFTSRMTAVTDLGLSTANLAPLRVLWGYVHTRTFPTPANFPYALQTRIVGAPNRYDRRNGIDTWNNTIPDAPGGMAAEITASRNDALRPIYVARVVYAAWNAGTAAGAAMGALPGAAVAAFNAEYLLRAGVAPPMGMTAGALMRPSARQAAEFGALHVGATAAVAADAANAIHAYLTGGVPVASDAQAAIHALFGGPALAAPGAPSGWTRRDPVTVAGHSSLTPIIAPYGAVNLEAVFIRFVKWHLLGVPSTISNSHFTGAMNWPGGNPPILISWTNCASGASIPAWRRSTMWWNGNY